MSTLEAAIAERHALQRRESERGAPPPTEVEAAMTNEWLAFQATQSTDEPPLSPEESTSRLCAARRDGCSWVEAMVVLALASGPDDNRPAATSSPLDWDRPTQQMLGSLPAADGEACPRVDGASLSPAEFLREYVAKSRPVVTSNLLTDWEASRTWSLEHLWSRAANETVKVYASPDGEFEAVRVARERMPPDGEPVCAGCEEGEHVLIRPAETETTFDHFRWLVDGYENPERARFYLQKHPLRRWRGVGLAAEASPPPHEALAPWLKVDHELLWLSSGQCPVAPLHYDLHENLHALVRGTKRFELIHPSQGKDELYDAEAPMRSLHYFWSWREEEMRGSAPPSPGASQPLPDATPTARAPPSRYMHSLNPLAISPSMMPFSAVRLDRTGTSRHPRAARVRRMLCEVNEGEVLFLPSFWWHTVDAIPPGGDAARGAAGGGGRDCGLTASINYFFKPYFRKGSDLRHFAHEPFYSFVRDRDAGEATHRDRWRRSAATRDAKEEL